MNRFCYYFATSAALLCSVALLWHLLTPPSLAWLSFAQCQGLAFVFVVFGVTAIICHVSEL